MDKLQRIGRVINFVSKIYPTWGGRLGYRLMCKPFSRKFKSKHLEYLNPAKVGGLMANGKKIQLYRWPSSGEKILLLHGWSSNSYRWRRYIDAARSKGYDCLAIDAPGHGMSAGKLCNVPLYGNAVTSIISAQPNISSIIAHSMGCIALLYAYYTQPNLPMPKSIILLASPGEASDFVKYVRSLFDFDDKTVDNIHQAFIDNFGHPISFYSSAEFAKSLSCDGLLIHDKSDQDTNYHYSEMIHTNWPQSNIWITTGKDHHLNDEEVLNRIFSYLEAQKKAILQ